MRLKLFHRFSCVRVVVVVIVSVVAVAVADVVVVPFTESGLLGAV